MVTDPGWADSCPYPPQEIRTSPPSLFSQSPGPPPSPTQSQGLYLAAGEAERKAMVWGLLSAAPFPQPWEKSLNQEE